MLLLLYISQKIGLCSRIYTMIDVYTGMSVDHSRRLLVVVSSPLVGRQREEEKERKSEAHARVHAHTVKERELY